MATRSFLSDLEEDLICPLCYEQFLPPRTPKELSCPHVYCQVCLVKMVEGERPTIICPECRLETSVPRNGIPALKTNLRLRSLAEKHHHGKKEVLKREALMREKKQVSAMDKLKMSNEMNTFRVTTTASCSQHAGENMKLFCTKCKVVICQFCLLEEHKLHPVEKLEVTMKRQEQDVNDMEQKLSKQMVQWERYLAMQKERENNLHTAIKVEREKIESYIEYITQELKKQAGEMMAEMRRLEQPQYDAIKHKQTQAEIHIANLKANLETVPKPDDEVESDYELFMRQLSFVSQMDAQLCKSPPNVTPSDLEVCVAEFYPKLKPSDIQLGKLKKPEATLKGTSDIITLSAHKEESPSASTSSLNPHVSGTSAEPHITKYDTESLSTTTTNVKLHRPPEMEVSKVAPGQGTDVKSSALDATDMAKKVPDQSPGISQDSVRSKDSDRALPPVTTSKMIAGQDRKSLTTSSSSTHRAVVGTKADAVSPQLQIPLRRLKSKDDSKSPSHKLRLSRTRKSSHTDTEIKTEPVMSETNRRQITFCQTHTVGRFQGAMKIAATQNQIIILQACTYQLFIYSYQKSSAKYKQILNFPLCSDYEPKDIATSLNHNFFIVAHAKGADMYSASGKERTSLFTTIKSGIKSYFTNQDTEVVSAVVNLEDVLFLGTTNNKIVAISIVDGTTAQTLTTPISPCFLATSSEHVAVSDNEQQVCVLNIISGQTIFQISASSPRGLCFHGGLDSLLVMENNLGQCTIEQYSGVTGEWVSRAVCDVGKGGMENDIICISPSTLAVAAVTSVKIFSKFD